MSSTPCDAEPEAVAGRLGEELLDRLLGLQALQPGDPLEDREHHEHRADHDQPGGEGHLAGPGRRAESVMASVSSRYPPSRRGRPRPRPASPHRSACAGHDAGAVRPRSRVSVSPSSPRSTVTGAAVDHLAGDQQPRERVADRGLDQPAQRPGAVRRVVAGRRPASSRAASVTSMVIRRTASRFSSSASCRSTMWASSSLGERVEEHDLVEPVEELRLERRAHHAPSPTRASSPGPASGRRGRPSPGCWSGSAACCGSRPCGPGRRSAGRRRAPAAGCRRPPGAPSRPRRAARREYGRRRTASVSWPPSS